MKIFFITGTDTGVGKTTCGILLLKAFQKQGFTTAALKPVATGCVWRNGVWISTDQEQLQAAVSPFYFEWPTAPSIAAAASHVVLSAEKIITYIKNAIQNCSADVMLIEGIGGWQVPLNSKETMADVVIGLGLPVILVVGMRLGCINHAILTHNAIQVAGVPAVGWIANCIDPNMHYIPETIETLKTYLTMPCLGMVTNGFSDAVISDLTLPMHPLSEFCETKPHAPR